MAKFTLDDIMRKVQGLVANANDESNPPEARENFRRQADALMLKYKIEELTNPEATAATSLKPIWDQFDVPIDNPEFANIVWSLMYHSLTHVGTKFTVQSRWTAEGRRAYFADVCGYDVDVRYARLIITSALLEFGRRLDPKVDPNRTEQENAYYLRMAGYEGRRIAIMLWGKDDKSLRPKARKLFEKEALKRGEDPAPLLGRGVNVKGYREDYASAFLNEFYMRLLSLRNSVNEDGAMVLASAQNTVDEMFYEKYPNLRPKPAIEATKWSDCERCKKAKSGWCREHRPNFGRGSTRKHNEFGASQGRAAARSVDIGRSGTGALS